jgi:signal transduction histidine kinase
MAATVSRQTVQRLWHRLVQLILAVPVRLKIAGIMLLPVLILGVTLNYWIRSGLSDWLSWILDNRRVQVAMQAGGRSVLLVTALAAIVSVLLTYLLMIMLTQPLLELHRVVNRVADGDLASRAIIRANDEIGEVARSVNQMIDRLVSTQQDLERNNRRLAAINTVTARVSREIELEPVLRAAADSTLEVTDFDRGWIVLREGEGERYWLACCSGVSPGTQALLVECIDGYAHRLLTQLGQDPAASLLTAHQPPPCVEPSQELSGGLYVTLALSARGQIFGLMTLVTIQEGILQDEERELLITVGSLLSEVLANARLHSSLREKEAARQVLLQALVRAQEEERHRLAHELHDGAGQVLTSLLVQLQSVSEESDASGVHAAIAPLCENVSAAIEQVRQISHRLRPAALEKLGLEVALHTLAEEMLEGTAIRLSFHSDLEERRLPEAVELAIYRIAQEALTNVLRHARATDLHLELVRLPYAVAMRIEDNGQGFDPDSISRQSGAGRLGLLGIRERAEMLGGSVVVLTAPESGTVIEVRLPVRDED